MTRIRRTNDEVREAIAHKSHVKKCSRLILHDMLTKTSCMAVVNNDCCMSGDESIRHPRDVTLRVTFRKSQKRLDRANAALVVIRVHGTFPGAGKSCEK